MPPPCFIVYHYKKHFRILVVKKHQGFPASFAWKSVLGLILDLQEFVSWGRGVKAKSKWEVPLDSEAAKLAASLQDFESILFWYPSLLTWVTWCDLHSQCPAAAKTRNSVIINRAQSHGVWAGPGAGNGVHQQLQQATNQVQGPSRGSHQEVG